MAKSDLSDEEKAKLVLGDVEPEKADEPTKEDEASTEPETDAAAEDKSEESEEEASTEEEPETNAAPTFTKQFPNFKSETLEGYVKELEQAYTNSTTEAIRLKREAEARAAAPVAAPPQPEVTPQPAPPAETNPDLLYAKAMREREMNSAFEEFAKSYPNVRESADFDRFAAASDGVWQAYARSHNNQAPTFKQLYKGIADILDWEPVGKVSKKDNAIRNSGVSSSTVSATAPVPKQPNVSDKEVDIFLKMGLSKSPEEARKSIAEVKA